VRIGTTYVKVRGPSCFLYERGRYVRGPKRRALWLRRDDRNRDDAPHDGDGERQFRAPLRPQDDVHWTDV